MNDDNKAPGKHGELECWLVQGEMSIQGDLHRDLHSQVGILGKKAQVAHSFVAATCLPKHEGSRVSWSWHDLKKQYE